MMSPPSPSTPSLASSSARPPRYRPPHPPHHVIIDRTQRLRRGEAHTLWYAHDWAACRAANLSDAVATIPPDRLAKTELMLMARAL